MQKHCYQVNTNINNLSAPNGWMVLVWLAQAVFDGKSVAP